MTTKDQASFDFFHELAEDLGRNESRQDAIKRAKEQGSDELVAMLDLVDELQTQPPVPAATESLERARARVLAFTPAPAKVPVTVVVPGLWERIQQGMRISAAPAWATAAVIAIMALLVTMATTVSVSASAIPGDPLYGVKIVSENIAKMLIFDASEREMYEQTIHARRMAELKKLVEINREARVNFRGEVLGRKGDRWLIDEYLVDVENGAELLEGLRSGSTVWVSALFKDQTFHNVVISDLYTPTPTPTQVPSPTPTQVPAGYRLQSRDADTPAPVTPLPTPRRRPTRRPTPKLTKPPPTATRKPKAPAKVNPATTPVPKLVDSSTATVIPVVQEFVHSGKLTRLNSSRLVVAGKSFRRNKSTNIAGAKVGNSVDVLYRVNSSGDSVAIQVYVRSATTEPRIVTVQGVVTDRTPAYVVVAGRKFWLTAQTGISGGTLVVGVEAWTRGHVATDGLLYADSIIISSPTAVPTSSNPQILTPESSPTLPIDLTPSVTPELSPTVAASETISPTPEGTPPTETPESDTPTASPVDTATATPAPGETPTPGPDETPTHEPVDTATPAPDDTATPASGDTSTPVPVDTATPLPGDTATPVPTPTTGPDTPAPTSTPVPTNTSAPSTNTPAPPTHTPDSHTNTPPPPTNTPPPPTNTPVPPTNTPKPPTNTPVPPTNTPKPPTNTPVQPTNTPKPPTPKPTNTPKPPPTATPEGDASLAMSSFG